jgi:hypothetical protein
VIEIDAAFLACGLAAWWSRRSAAQPAPARAALSSNERALAVAALVAAAGAGTSLLANVLDSPHGEWDAWATWNIRARWLIDGTPAWLDAFQKPNIHRGYPLLLPCTVARSWVYAGERDPFVPAAVAAAYGAALVLLLGTTLAALRGRAQAMVGALCLLGTPVFLRIVPWQYADVPLAFNLLAAVALLSLYDRSPERGRPLLLWAGVATGLAAWTKNEGIALALGIVAVHGVRMIVRREAGLRSVGWFAAGLLPPAAIVLYFKMTLASRSSQFGQTGVAMLEKIADPTRYGPILRSAAFELGRGMGPVLLALVVYAILLGRTRDRDARRLSVPVVLIVGCAAMNYALAYLITRADLAWQLDNSMNRLLMQIWPCILLATLLYLASPSEHDAPVAARRSRGDSRARSKAAARDQKPRARLGA